MSYEIDFLGSYDKASLIAEMKRIAEVTGMPRVKYTDFAKYGRVSFDTVFEKFGSLRSANEAAGLNPSHVYRRTNEELLEIVSQLWDQTLKDEGRRPLKTDMQKYRFPVGACAITTRFGTWNKALIAANEMVERREKEQLFLDPKSAALKITSPKAAAKKARQERHPISDRVRFLVFKRDLYQCRICRKTGVALELDHIIPVAQGGKDQKDNLQTLCFACNRGKRDTLQ